MRIRMRRESFLNLAPLRRAAPRPDSQAECFTTNGTRDTLFDGARLHSTISNIPSSCRGDRRYRPSATTRTARLGPIRAARGSALVACAYFGGRSPDRAVYRADYRSIRVGGRRPFHRQMPQFLLWPADGRLCGRRQRHTPNTNDEGLTPREFLKRPARNRTLKGASSGRCTGSGAGKPGNPRTTPSTKARRAGSGPGSRTRTGACGPTKGCGKARVHLVSSPS
jgi:hypothetical protein